MVHAAAGAARVEAMVRILPTLALLVAGCTPTWSGPAELTTDENESAPVDTFIPVYGRIPSGGSPAPMGLRDFDLRCMEATVCATAVVRSGEWHGSEGRVAGLRAGESDVVVTFVHPVTHAPERLTFHVGFHAASRHLLAVGEPLPTGSSAGQLLADVPGRGPFSCTTDALPPDHPFVRDAVATLPPKVVLLCEPPVEIVPGRQHFSASQLSRQARNPADSVRTCVSVRDGKIAGLRFSDRRTHLCDTGPVDEAQCPRRS